MPISLSGSLNLSGSLTTTGTITATTLVVQTITSSISSITGSTNFGSLAANTHTFTGSLNVTGSGNFSGSINIGASATTGKQLIVNQTGASGYFLSGEASGTEIAYWYYDASTIQFSSKSSTRGLALMTNDTTRLFISASGNVGIGTSSPSFILDIKASATPLRIVNTLSASNQLAWIKLRQSDANNFGADIGIDTTTGGDFVIGRNDGTDTFTEAFRIKRSNGNIGIGCVPSFKLQVQADDAGSYDQASGQIIISGATNSNKRLNIGYNTTNNIGFIQAGINGTGYSTLLLNPNGGDVSIGTTGGGRKLSVVGTSTPLFLNKTNNVSGSYCNIWALGGSETNATSSYYLYCDTDFVGVRVVIYGNGNIANVNNSYGAYSDIKLKENITDATPKLDDLLKVKIRNFNLKGSDIKQIGVVAQELEEVFPSMIEESNDTIKDEDGKYIETGEKTKTVKYSVFVPMLIKAIQELKAEIDELKNK